MSQATIRAAFETRLKTWADAQVPPIPVAFENVAFTPPSGTYLRVFILPATTTSETMDTVHRGYKGVVQVTIVVDLNAGSQKAQQIAQALDSLFPMPGFNYSGLRINMTSPMSLRNAQSEDDRYAYPVSGNYRVDIV